MRIVIVTGMSGAGKSTALKMLEDMQYFCVDNLPIPLLEKFASLMMEAGREELEHTALGIDIRSGNSLDELMEVLRRMRQAGFDLRILYLDASDAVLVKRYKETRRRHPLSSEGRVDEGIRLERERLEVLRKNTDYLIDTSQMLTRELRGELENIFVENKSFHNLVISIVSFGFKYAIPADADLVFDVRFLPNPYYVDELRPLTGLDEQVFRYVMDSEDTRAFLDRIEDLIRFLAPKYAREGKTSLVIAVGCTGGKHRSVSIAREIFTSLSGLEGYSYRLEHRDIAKDRPQGGRPSVG